LSTVCLYTGTHGTGIGVGNYATTVTRMELITANGETLSLSASENSDIFKAAQVQVKPMLYFYHCYEPAIIIYTLLSYYCIT